MFVGIPWVGWVAIVAIVGGVLNATIRAVCKHRERIALIQQGINPDAPYPDDRSKTALHEL